VVVVKQGFTPENYKRSGERAIKEYYEHYQPFDHTKPLWTERLVTFNLGDDKYKMQGYIDRLDRRADGVLEIHDYKSSGKLPGQSKVDDDKQLALYHLAVQEILPDNQGIVLVWHYVLFDTELRSRRSSEQLEELKAEYRVLIDEIENAKEYPTNESGLCNWCGYQEYCPAKKHLLKLEDFPEDERTSDEGYVLVDKYAKLMEQDKDLKKEIEDLKERLIGFAKENDFSVIRGTDKYVKVTIKEEGKLPSKSVDSQAFEELVQIIRNAGLWEEFVVLDTRKLFKEFETKGLPIEIQDIIKKYIITEEKSRMTLGTLKTEPKADD
jgi:putative RecB family exonuclease